MMKKLQNLGKAIMQPVAILPVAALLMGIGYWIDSSGSTNNIIAAFLNKTGGAILGNLGIIFAVGIAYGLSKDRNGAAGLSGLVAFLIATTLLSEGTVAIFRG
ncbi:MAG: PTS transporter subunit EIIC, partial [Fenollaria timonensis]